jgi:hypothetical protein
MLIGMGSRRRSASQAIDLPSDGGVNFERLFTIQILEQADGRRLIDAPADVLYTRAWKGKRWLVTFIYLEHPDVRRTRLDKLARRLGYGAKKKLHRGGLVQDRAFAEKLLANWSTV